MNACGIDLGAILMKLMKSGPDPSGGMEISIQEFDVLCERFSVAFRGFIQVLTKAYKANS